MVCQQVPRRSHSPDVNLVSAWTAFGRGEEYRAQQNPTAPPGMDGQGGAHIAERLYVTTPAPVAATGYALRHASGFGPCTGVPK